MLALLYLGMVGPDSHPGYCDSRAQKLTHPKFSPGSWGKPPDHDVGLTLTNHRRKKEGRKGWLEGWLSGRIFDCSAVLRKFSKADETSWS